MSEQQMPPGQRLHRHTELLLLSGVLAAALAKWSGSASTRDLGMTRKGGIGGQRSILDISGVNPTLFQCCRVADLYPAFLPR
jgi:hypothetical protein